MRELCILAVIFVGGPALGSEVFDSWQVFPGPNPEAAELLPNHTDAFRIGHIIFTYDAPLNVADHGPHRAADDLPSMGEVIRLAEPNQGLQALVTSQLGQRHDFELEQVIFDFANDSARGWTVTWHLFPSLGGFTGKPFRYMSVFAPTGQVLYPACHVFDAYYHFGLREWFCSTLELSQITTPRDAVISQESAQRIAAKRMQEFEEVVNSEDRAEKAQMRFAEAVLIHVPWPRSKTDPIDYCTVWAVNFVRESNDSPDRERRFTIWVSADGHPCDLRLLRWGVNGFIEPGDRIEELRKSSEPPTTQGTYGTGK